MTIAIIERLRNLIVGAAALGGALVFGGCAVDGAGGPEATRSTASAYTAVVGDVAFGKSWVSSQGAFTTDSGTTGDSYNSAGGTIQFTALAMGQYRVDVPGLGATIGGDVQVTAAGEGAPDPVFCKVARWGSSGTTLNIWVNCFDIVGTPRDAFFNFSYVRRADTPGPEAAYVWAYNATGGSYSPSSAYAWNSTGGAIRINHNAGTGYYVVNLAGQDLSKGTIQVTAYGSSTAYCTIAGWSQNWGIGVACFKGGTPFDTQFDLLYSAKSPNGTPSMGYAAATQPTASSYTPANQQLFINTDCCSTPTAVSTPITVQRFGTGAYVVTFPHMALGFYNGTPETAIVTALSQAAYICIIYNNGPVSGSSPDASATVGCFDWTGAPADVGFMITYSAFAYTIG